MSIFKRVYLWGACHTFSRDPIQSKRAKPSRQLDATVDTAMKKGKGRARNLGKLEALLDMPLDIFLEVRCLLVFINFLLTCIGV